jgi:phosphocarrier protein
MVRKQAVIKNSMGIHCRPSAVILNATSDYDGECRVIADSGETDLNSVMGLLALGLQQGDAITIEIEGPDEESFCQQLVELFETQFDFPPRE